MVPAGASVGSGIFHEKCVRVQSYSISVIVIREWVCLKENNPINQAIVLAPSTGQTENNRQCRSDDVIHPMTKL